MSILALWNLESKPFDDVELTDWYAPYAFVAKKNAFIKTSGNFDAGYEMTRSDFAGMIYKIGKATDAL